MRRVIRQRPQALPNQRMVRLADQLLQLDGRLLEARDTYVFSLSFDSRTLE
jgi:predicted protein tyrosine phosphatase